LHGGQGLLLELDGSTTLRPLEAGLIYRSAPVKEALGLRALLVRPDGFVAWATDGQPDRATAAASVTRWFGA
jgi:hypothetical protein